ncbi:MAG TPA: hypothetical protein VMJ52_05765 [Xanthobacteraceae bacterium]|nr:hypothetical protein [Xanthobacteraceae bacterium]
MVIGKSHHLVDRESLERVNKVVMVGLIGSGLAACGIGAAIYDFGRWFAIW